MFDKESKVIYTICIEKKGNLKSMNWFYKLERKYGKYAIHNLMSKIIVIYAIGAFIELMMPQVYDVYLSLDAAAILNGQVWRIVTFILQPPTTSILLLFFVLYFYYMIGTVLERIWGAFRFNVYFFSGMFLHVIAALVIYLVFGSRMHMSTYYINLALFMAFAMEQPDMEVLLFFVLPIKIKWLGILDAVIFAVTIIGGFLSPILPFSVLYRFALMGIGFSKTTAVAALISMLNFILFVLLFKRAPMKNTVQKNFNKAYKTAKKAEKRRSYTERVYNANSEKTTWETANKPYHKLNPTATKHRCAVCGKTELDGENMTFRYCSKCEGDYEYCQDHLYTHIHVTKENNANNVIDIRK